MSKFQSASNKGFTITFENGWSISVQWGYMNYCENQHHPDGKKLHEQYIVESSTAEVGIWDENGKWYEFPNGDIVKGYCSADEVADLIEKVSHW